MTGLNSSLVDTASPAIPVVSGGVSRLSALLLLLVSLWSSGRVWWSLSGLDIPPVVFFRMAGFLPGSISLKRS